MKLHALVKGIAGITLTVLILAPWANSSFAKHRAAGQLIGRNALAALSNYHPTVEGSNDEEQVDVAPDSVASELPPGAWLKDDTGKVVMISGTNCRRDLGLYLSYLRERGPPFNA